MDTERSIEFWFDFASNYSYLSVMRIEKLAAAQGVKIRWKPFLLGPIFKSFGWENSPFVLQKEKGQYIWRDMVRQCQKYSLPWMQPTTFPRAAVLATRVALLGAEQPWINTYCQTIMQLNFASDQEIASPAIISQTLTQLGLPAAELIQQAQTEQNKQHLRTQTALAKQRGVFGAPTFFVGDEMFWGNDRLDEALILAAQSTTRQGVVS